VFHLYAASLCLPESVADWMEMTYMVDKFNRYALKHSKMKLQIFPKLSQLIQKI